MGFICEKDKTECAGLLIDTPDADNSRMNSLNSLAFSFPSSPACFKNNSRKASFCGMGLTCG